jgi:hypothetical protein
MTHHHCERDRLLLLSGFEGGVPDGRPVDGAIDLLYRYVPIPPQPGSIRGSF